jgi:nitrate/nitrite-specific signal transduction histidine kinase
MIFSNDSGSIRMTSEQLIAEVERLRKAVDDLCRAAETTIRTADGFDFPVLQRAVDAARKGAK